MMEKIPNEYSFGIAYGIGPKYLPIWVSVLVSDLNQNSGFGHTLLCCHFVATRNDNLTEFFS